MTKCERDERSLRQVAPVARLLVPFARASEKSSGVITCDGDTVVGVPKQACHWAGLPRKLHWLSPTGSIVRSEMVTRPSFACADRYGVGIVLGGGLNPHLVERPHMHSWILFVDAFHGVRLSTPRLPVCEDTNIVAIHDTLHEWLYVLEDFSLLRVIDPYNIVIGEAHCTLIAIVVDKLQSFFLAAERAHAAKHADVTLQFHKLIEQVSPLPQQFVQIRYLLQATKNTLSAFEPAFSHDRHPYLGGVRVALERKGRALELHRSGGRLPGVRLGCRRVALHLSCGQGRDVVGAVPSTHVPILHLSVTVQDLSGRTGQRGPQTLRQRQETGRVLPSCPRPRAPLSVSGAGCWLPGAGKPCACSRAEPPRPSSCEGRPGRGSDWASSPNVRAFLSGALDGTPRPVPTVPAMGRCKTHRPVSEGGRRV
eukprot:scaffold2911_cov414-Prasinococcus_capsulatus_cf.AAC.23